MNIYGASGHARVIIDIILSKKEEIDDVYDVNPKIKNISGYKVVHSTQELDTRIPSVIAIGNNRIRRQVADSAEGEFVPFLAHPTSVISPSSKIGEGTVIMPLAAINSQVLIGRHCIINTGAVVEHDSILEDFVHISPKAAVAGNVRIGEGSHIGTGAVVIPGIAIGKWTTIGAGSVIIRDVPDYATVVGNPGRIVGTTK